MPLTDAEAGRLLPPEINTPENRRALIDAGANAERVGYALSEMRRANPDLITDANFQALIRAGENARGVGIALKEMRRANPDLITDANREALIRAGENPEGVGDALSQMRLANPNLITDANREALIRAGANAQGVGIALSEMRLANPDLITDANREALIRAGENAVQVAQAIINGQAAARVPLNLVDPAAIPEAPSGTLNQRIIDTAREAGVFIPEIPDEYNPHQGVAGEAPAVRPPSTPRTRLQFWRSIIPDTERPEEVPALDIPSASTSDVCNFLDRLQETEEFRGQNTKLALAARIIKVFEVMASDEDFRNLSLVIIANSLTSCADNIILGLDNLETAMLVHQAEHSEDTENELRSLGRRMLMLEKVEQKIREYLSQHRGNPAVQREALEIELAFKTRLKERLNLPFSTTTMLFRGCAHVSNEPIDTAGALILTGTTDSEVVDYLHQWEPWQKYQRRQQAMQGYSELALSDDIPKDIDWACPLSATDFSPGREATDGELQPVMYKGRIYNYDDFRQVYIEQGKDPFSRAIINWSELRRVLPPQQALSPEGDDASRPKSPRAR